MPSVRKTVVAVFAAALLASTAQAEGDAVQINLNAVEAQPNACRLVLTAQAPSEISELIMETVLFDQSDRVMMLTLFDFATLPAGKLRVRQFDIPGASCSGISRVLFNGVDSCQGPGCEAPVGASSAVKEIEVLG